MKACSMGFAVLSAMLLTGATAGAAEDPDKILERMDATINGYQDQYMAATMTVIDTNGKEKKYDFTTLQKTAANGDQKRLIRFTSGEQKGLATLVEDDSHVYTFLPGFKKSRRVATHAMKQSIAGSDMSNEDAAFGHWHVAYTCKHDTEDGTYWWLACTPRAGQKPPYPKVVLQVRKDNYHQDGVMYYDAGGAKVKSYTNTKMKDYGGAIRNSDILIKDEQTGHKTRLEVKEFKVNQGIPDKTFTVRELEWGQ